MKWAWVEGVVARDVCPGNPAELYHPDFAVRYDTEVPDGTANGAVLVNGEWVNPAPPAPPEPVAPIPPRVTPIEFKLLFTSSERVAIRRLREGTPPDEVLIDWFSILDDPALTSVDLGGASARDGVAYLVALGVLTPDRAAAILSGTPA